jgi:hypothetical protein
MVKMSERALPGPFGSLPFDVPERGGRARRPADPRRGWARRAAAWVLALSAVLALVVVPLITEGQCRAGSCTGDYSYRWLIGVAVSVMTGLVGLFVAGVLLLVGQCYRLGAALVFTVAALLMVALWYVR